MVQPAVWAVSMFGTYHFHGPTATPISFAWYFKVCCNVKVLSYKVHYFGFYLIIGLTKPKMTSRVAYKFGVLFIFIVILEQVGHFYDILVLFLVHEENKSDHMGSLTFSCHKPTMEANKQFHFNIFYVENFNV